MALADRIRADRSLRVDERDLRRDLGNEVTMFDRLVRELTRKPGADVSIFIDVCHRLAARGAMYSLRETVYWLALRPHHSVVDVLKIFRRKIPRVPQDSWTVVLHEYIAYGNDLSDDETVTRYLTMVKESGHELGVLPAKLVHREPPARLTPTCRASSRMPRFRRSRRGRVCPTSGVASMVLWS